MCILSKRFVIQTAPSGNNVTECDRKFVKTDLFSDRTPSGRETGHETAVFIVWEF